MQDGVSHYSSFIADLRTYAQPRLSEDETMIDLRVNDDDNEQEEAEHGRVKIKDNHSAVRGELITLASLAQPPELQTEPKTTSKAHPKPVTFPGMEALLQKYGLSTDPALRPQIAAAQELLDPRKRHPITGMPIPEPASRPVHGAFPTGLRMNHGIPGGPSNLQLLGYAGLENATFTGWMIETKNIHRVYQQYFRYDTLTCPAGVIYVDSWHGQVSREAWLYVRNEGMVEWKRDLLAERGAQRHFAYLTRSEEDADLQWQQVLGDALDVTAGLNMWVKVKK